MQCGALPLGVFFYQSNYEEVTEGSNTKKIHYIAAPTGLAVMHIMDNTGNNTYTTITDHLGSLNMLIDDNGDIVAEQAYDAWGNVRSASPVLQDMCTLVGGICNPDFADYKDF